MMALCHEWFGRAAAAYPAEAKYPTLTFDLLRHGGASQTHPHMQPHLVRHRYPGKWEAVRQAACAYSERHGRSYFVDVATVHAAIGLVVRRTRHVIAYVSLTSAATGPQLEIVSDGELSTAADGAAAQMGELGGILFEVLRAAQSALGWDAISASCAFPPVDDDDPDSLGGMPRVCRVVPRGRHGAKVSDISANELFETPVVSVDLFKAAGQLRSHLQHAQGG
jgi:galactose-1-phosphate uridylyltransferase